jgi:hypothetical protein
MVTVTHDHVQTHITLGRTSLEEGSVRRRDLYLTTHKSQQTDIHALAGIRNRNPSKLKVQTHTLDRAATGKGSLYFYA